VRAVVRLKVKNVGGREVGEGVVAVVVVGLYKKCEDGLYR